MPRALYASSRFIGGHCSRIGFPTSDAKANDTEMVRKREEEEAREKEQDEDEDDVLKKKKKKTTTKKEREKSKERRTIGSAPGNRKDTVAIERVNPVHASTSTNKNTPPSPSRPYCGGGVNRGVAVASRFASSSCEPTEVRTCIRVTVKYGRRSKGWGLVSLGVDRTA